MKIRHFNFKDTLSPDNLTLVAEFLCTELEQFGDSQEAITKAMNYAMRDPATGRGGLVTTMHEDEKIIGAVVINHTGMEDYIPENILVYIAIHRSCRGQGLGRLLLSSVLGKIEGDVALHVEPSNPAIHLYKKMGFSTKYVEMRLFKSRGIE